MSKSNRDSSACLRLITSKLVELFKNEADNRFICSTTYKVDYSVFESFLWMVQLKVQSLTVNVRTKQ